MIKIKYPKDIEKHYYETIKKSKANKFKGLNFEEYYDKNFKTKLGYSLEDILCGNFVKLQEIKNKIGTKYSSKNKRNNSVIQFFNYDKSNSKKTKVLISKLQPKISKFIEENIEVHTCYFCNIEYINKFETSNKKVKNSFTLDHFIDKATYPFFSS